MENLGTKIRNLREAKKVPLRTVAAYLDIDQAILSKIERGQRNAKRAQVVMLAKYFKVKENELLVSWLSDKLVKELGNETIGLDALKLAEEKVEYIAFKRIDRNAILKKIKAVIAGFKQIEKAYIYGSFARKQDGPKSDIDIAFKASADFSYFDLADVQHELEKKINRKIDVGFIDSFKPYILEHVKPDLKLIYER